REPVDLSQAGVDEVCRVGGGGVAGALRVVGLLVVARTGDAMVLEAVERRQATGDPTEVAIGDVARVPLAPAPYLLGRLGIAPECDDPRFADDGSIDAVDRPGRRVGDAVGVENEPPYAEAREFGV